MPPEVEKLGAWLIVALLGVNAFFIRDFMKRMEKSIEHLTSAIGHHAEKLADLDREIAVIRKKGKRGPAQDLSV